MLRLPTYKKRPHSNKSLDKKVFDYGQKSLISRLPTYKKRPHSNKSLDKKVFDYPWGQRPQD